MSTSSVRSHLLGEEFNEDVANHIQKQTFSLKKGSRMFPVINYPTVQDDYSPKVGFSEPEPDRSEGH